MQRSYSLAELAEILGAELQGDPSYKIHALATLQSAGEHELSFIANPAYQKHLATTAAAAVLIKADMSTQFAGNKLLVTNPYSAYAQASSLFDPTPVAVSGIHPSAIIGINCNLGEGVSIGANAVIGDDVELGDRVTIGPGCFIGNDTRLGAGTRLNANVSIYHGVYVGEDCLFHSGSVIGADGFGFAPSKKGWQKIHQLGGVVIGNRVEIGACTCIDRGALDDTRIGDGVILDNLIQIAHNVSIGNNTAIAGHTAIAGSTRIGANCTIAGAVGIVGHLELTDSVHVTAMSLVTSSITEPGSYSSGTPLDNTKTWRKNAARFRQLDKLAARLIKLDRAQHLAE